VRLQLRAMVSGDFPHGFVFQSGLFCELRPLGDGIEDVLDDVRRFGEADGVADGVWIYAARRFIAARIAFPCSRSASFKS
jgi:hypothetical protein